ncbi:hypothetical protein EA187_03375 [Lujinxingia sediminis]|uniref:Transporter n=1 Tax=Lujinxingia sediminis TaxID=2480984 RepID=A0ABY0CXW4_9DELT|nr:hypothetical protein [Lujinxingia sediminis]RVU48490.1 hypothetical protein EA187_03375 [Lujinxingia sediminis]
MPNSLRLRAALPFCAALLVSSLVSILAMPDAMAGPWTKKSGDYYVKVGESAYQASAFRTPEGFLVTGVDYFSATTYLYGEVGVLEGMHLQTYVPLTYARNRFGTQSYTDFGPGDMNVAIQVSPLQLSVPTALRLEAKLPLYGRPSGDLTPARGDEQVDLTLWLSAGGGFHDLGIYFYADIGYQYRSAWTLNETEVGDFSDGFVTMAQVGYNLFDTATVALTSSAVFPLSDDLISKSYLTVGPSIFFPITDRIALEADGYFTPFSRNSAAGWAVGLGVSVRSPD